MVLPLQMLTIGREYRASAAGSSGLAAPRRDRAQRSPDLEFLLRACGLHPRAGRHVCGACVPSRYPRLRVSGIETEATSATAQSAVTYQANHDSCPIDLNHRPTYSAVPPNSALATAYDSPTPSARTSVGNSSAFTNPLIEV